MNINSKSGMTLVEMMISVALVVIVVGISTGSYLALAKASSIATQCSEMHSDLRLAFDKMSKEVISSSGIVDGGTTWFRLVAERPSGPQTVFYVFSTGKLYQMDTALNVIAENVADFKYTLYAKDGVTVTSVATNAYSIDLYVKTERQVSSQTFDDILQTRIMLRNK